MIFRSFVFAVSVFALSSSALAQTVPVPAPKPEVGEPASEADKGKAETSEQKIPDEQAAPVPDPKPAEPAPAAETEPAKSVQPGDKEAKPDETGKPPAASATPKDGAPLKGAGDEPKTTKAPAPVLTIEPETDAVHAACMAELKQIGSTFEEAKRIDDGNGCGIDKPISVTGVLPGIALEPKGTMRCETALELARWTKEAVLPAAQAALGDDGPLTTINQASSYICRLRNNAATGKISEHARGNAIDIASFTFKSGKSIAIQPRDEDSTLSGAFQRAVTATGCLYFETVLDPGSDEAHENHLHFDVLQRKGGYRYCR